MKLDRRTRVEQAICADWYDGAVGGLLLLTNSAEQRWFRFELLTWDGGQNTRVFCLAAASSVPIFERAGTPRIWWLQTCDEPVASEFERIRKQSQDFKWLLVSDGYFNNVVELVELTQAIKATIPVESLPDYGNSADFPRWSAIVKELS